MSQHGVARWSGFLAVVLWAAMSTSPASGQVKVERDVEFGPWKDAIRISNPQIEAVVAPAAGGRIISYGRPGGKNLLWVNPHAKEDPYWKNWGGDKVWIWPQDGWPAIFGGNWPPPAGADQAAYSVTVRETPLKSTIVLESPESKGFGAKVRREIILAADKVEMTVVNTLVATGEPAPIPLASWTVTQVPRPHAVVVRRLAESPLENAAKSLMETPWPGQIAAHGQDMLIVTPSPTVSGKLGFDADVLAVVVDQEVMIQRLVVPTEEGIAAGDRAQLFTEPEKVDRPADAPPYAELEWTGPRVKIGGDQTASHTVVWSLHAMPADRNLADVVRDILSR